MSPRTELKRQIGLGTATALVVGEVVGVGIFLTPAGMAKSLGSPFWVLVVWLVMGATAVCGALCYGELAARYPQAGGSYVYLREAYGRCIAFLFGWMALLVMDPGLTAALAVGLGSYAGYMFNLSAAGTKTIAISAIVFVAAANVFGLKLGAGLMRWLTVTKLGLLFFLLLWGFGFQLGNWTNFTPFIAQHANSAPLVAALAGGIVAAFFSFGGWWDVTKLAGEVRDPARTLPRALVYGVLIVTVVYILTTTVFFYLVPLDSVTTGETFAAQAGEVLFGRAGANVFSTIVIVAVLSSLAAIVMSAPRVYFAMARDGLFVPAVAALHPRFGSPARAIVLQALLASMLVMLGNFNQIIAYFIFVVVLFIALTVAALFVLRRREPSNPDYQAAGYPFTPIFLLLLVVALLVLLGSSSPKQSALGVGVVALGIPVYYFLFARRIEESTE